MAWLIEESGNMEDGFSWNLFECEDGRLTMRATLYDEKFALKMKSAMDWLDSLGSGLMRLAQDGIIIDTNTGKVWTPPKTRRTPRLTITTTKKRSAK